MESHENLVTDGSQSTLNARQHVRIDRPASPPDCSISAEPPIDVQPVLRELCEFVSELIASPTLSAEPLLSVVENIRSEAQLVSLDCVLALLNRPIGELIACGDQTASRSLAMQRVLAEGLRTAWLAAKLLPSFGLPRSTHETLLIATLLRDTGIAILADRRNVAPEQLETRHRDLYRMHPQIGAALAGGIRRCAGELPTLIAEHHERLNGTGHPAGRRARQLTTSSRVLQIVSQFAFLAGRRETLEQNSPGANIRNACAEIEQQTRRGWFDRGLTDILLQQVCGSTSASPETATEPATAVPLERHAVPAPKFLRRRNADVDLNVFVQSTNEAGTADRTLPPNR